MMLDDVSNYDCKYCDNDFEEGDTLVTVWSGQVREGDEWEGQNMDMAHGRCVSVTDGIPDTYARIENDRTGAVHLGRWTGDGFVSLCKTMTTGSEYGDAEQVAPGDVDGKDLCGTCERLA